MIIYREEEFGYLVFNTETKKCCILNQSAKETLELITKNPITKVIGIISKKYNLSKGEVGDRIENLIKELKIKGILPCTGLNPQ